MRSRASSSTSSSASCGRAADDGDLRHALDHRGGVPGGSGDRAHAAAGADRARSPARSAGSSASPSCAASRRLRARCGVLLTALEARGDARESVPPRAFCRRWSCWCSLLVAAEAILRDAADAALPACRAPSQSAHAIVDRLARSARVALDHREGRADRLRRERRRRHRCWRCSFPARGCIERAFYPYTVFFQTVPIVAIAPLLVIWFEAGTASRGDLRVHRVGLPGDRQHAGRAALDRPGVARSVPALRRR